LGQRVFAEGVEKSKTVKKVGERTKKRGGSKEERDSRGGEKANAE